MSTDYFILRTHNRHILKCHTPAMYDLDAYSEKAFCTESFHEH